MTLRRTSRDAVEAVVEATEGRRVRLAGLGEAVVRIHRGGVRTVEATLPQRGRVAVELGPGEEPGDLVPNAVRTALWAVGHARLRASLPLLDGGRG